jgi:hypothetical protein
MERKSEAEKKTKKSKKGGRKKERINAADFADALPMLKRLIKAPKTLRPYVVQRQKNAKLDLICKCVNAGLANLRETDFSDRRLKQLNIDKEKLRFLSDFSRCSHKKQKCLLNKRKKLAKQSAGSIALILSVVVPLIAEIISHYSK